MPEQFVSTETVGNWDTPEDPPFEEDLEEVVVVPVAEELQDLAKVAELHGAAMNRRGDLISQSELVRQQAVHDFMLLVVAYLMDSGQE